MYSSTRPALILALLGMCIPTFAQRTGTGGSPSTGSRPTAPTNTPTIPQPPTNCPNTQGERQVMYISGSVVLQEGNAPPEPVAIERVCGGSAHKEGYTDSKGHYQIQLGQNFELQDVSESGGSGGFGMGSRSVTGNPGS